MGTVRFDAYGTIIAEVCDLKIKVFKVTDNEDVKELIDEADVKSMSALIEKIAALF